MRIHRSSIAHVTFSRREEKEEDEKARVTTTVDSNMTRPTNPSQSVVRSRFNMIDIIDCHHR
jgi:hypothetical protein